MADQNAPNPATAIPENVDGVDAREIAADTVTVADLFAAVINPVTAGSVDALYGEAAAALAGVSATELLDEPDIERMVRLAVVALQDGAGALLAPAERRPCENDSRPALAAALQSHAARTLLSLDHEHVATQ
jgi:hypothetical protein